MGECPDVDRNHYSGCQKSANLKPQDERVPHRTARRAVPTFKTVIALIFLILGRDASPRRPGRVHTSVVPFPCQIRFLLGETFGSRYISAEIFVYLRLNILLLVFRRN
jgi:hypothetical protein